MSLEDEITMRCINRLHNLERLRYKQQIRALEKSYDYLKRSV